MIALSVIFTIFVLGSSAPKSNKGSRRIARYGIYTALAIALGLLESFLPDFFLPGMKIGFANVAILVILLSEGFFPALSISLIRVVLISLLRGNFLSMGGWMSFAGALASVLAMALLVKLLKGFSPVSASVFGSFCHVLAQMGVCLLYVHSLEMLFYLPFLLISAFLSGVLIGIIAKRVSKATMMERAR